MAQVTFRASALRTWLTVAVAMGGLLTAPAAMSQMALPSTIETTEAATIKNAPDYVEFRLHFQAEGTTMAEAMAEVIPFESKLRDELAARDMIFIQLEVSGPAVPDVSKPFVTGSARLRFGAVGFGEAEEGPKAFAALCDKIVEVARALKCSPEGPIMGVIDRVSVETAAVAQAMENAYPHADAAARAMRAQIVAVDSVQVQSVNWGPQKGGATPGEPIGGVTCTAKVRVSYVFTASG